MDEFTERELNKKYQGTYAGLRHKTSGEVVCTFMQRVDGGNVLGCNEVGGARQAYSLADWEILPPPKSQVLRYDKHVYVYKHRPERQWQVGLSQNNVSVSSPLESLINLLEQKSVKLGWIWERGCSFFLPLFLSKPSLSVSMGMSLIEATEAVSSPLTDKFWLSHSETDTDFYLWFMDILVASVNKQENTITLINSLYAQEVQDLISRKGERYVIQ